MKQYFCDWCGEKQEHEDMLRKVELLIFTEEVCPKCNRRISKLKKEIKKETKPFKKKVIIAKDGSSASIIRRSFGLLNKEEKEK